MHGSIQKEEKNDFRKTKVKRGSGSLKPKGVNAVEKIGIGIIGAGAIAAVHVDAYKQFADRCEIKAICDVFRDKAEKLKESKNLAQATVVEDWQEVAAREDIDAVSVCLPPHEHAEVSISLLDAGKHVLVEKPMALSLFECKKMIEASERNGKVLSVVSQNRYKTPVMKVKRLIEEQVAGRVLFCMVNSFWWRGESYYDLWWRGRWSTEGGGCLISHAVHHIDLVQWILGMPQKVTGIISNLAHDNSECEDLAIGILHYPNMIVEVNASLVSHGEEQEIVFQAEKARLSIPWKPVAFKQLENGFPTENTDFLQLLQEKYNALPQLEFEGHPAQIRNFLDAIEGKDKLLVDGYEGYKAIEIIMAIYKSACTGTTVSLPIPPDDDFYHKETMVKLMPHFHEKTREKTSFETNVITLGRDLGR